MRTSVSHGVAAIIYFLLPWGVVGMIPDHRDNFFIAYDLVSELGALWFMTRLYRTANDARSQQNMRLLVAAIAFLGVADLLFVGSLGRKTFPHQQLIGEWSYSVAFTLLGLMLLRTILSMRQRRVTLVVTLAASVASMALQLVYILGPLDGSHPPFPMAIRVNHYLYSLTTAWVFGAALVLSLRTRSWLSFLLLGSLLLCLVSDYSLRYHAAVYQYASSAEATAGWTAGVGGLFACLAVAVGRGVRLWLGQVTAAPWNSLRCLIGGLVFLGHMMLLAAAVPAGLLKVCNGHQVTALLGIMFVFWLLANALALTVATRLEHVAALMPTPEALEAAGGKQGALLVPVIDAQATLAETDALIKRYNALARKTEALAKEKVCFEREVAVASMARQVSHDIRSPLAALAVVLPELDKIGEDYRVLARSAIHRVQDIANTLLNTMQEKATESVHKPADVLVSAALDGIVSEKRMEYRHQLDVSLDLRVAPSSYGAFVRIDHVEFKRAISNLINNAVEALDGAGCVALELSATQREVLVAVQDTGRGIPPELLSQLGTRGQTFGKRGGHGLGLAQSRELADRASGSLGLESVVGKGTTVTLNLPRIAAPQWFMKAVELIGISRVVILDDDQSIHNVWRERFRTCNGVSSNLRLIHLQNSEQFRSFVAKHGSKDCFYLVDCDLRGSAENGLDLVEDLCLAQQAALVTSGFEEAEIIARCQRLSVKMIPKPVAAAVPLLT